MLILFIWGLVVLGNLFILFLNVDGSFRFAGIGDEQYEVGRGDILNADEVDDDVDGVEEFP